MINHMRYSFEAKRKQVSLFCSYNDHFKSLAFVLNFDNCKKSTTPIAWLADLT